MTDIRADEPQGDDSRLPWLEAVDEEEEGQGGPSPLKLIVAVLIGLAAIGALVGGLFWLGNRDRAAGGEAEVIAAPAGEYKVRPDDPGGLAVEGEGDTAFAASAGDDPKGQIDTGKVAEAPVTAPKAGPAPAPAPAAPKTAPKAGPGPAPAPAPAASGPMIQLGAFSSQAGAAKAWTALSARFAYLAPLTHSVVPVASGGRTLYRLRASGPGAANICGRLRVAGESCVTVE